MLPVKVATLWKVMRALKSCKVELQIIFVKLVIEADILLFIPDDWMHFFYELRQWKLFKDLLWQLIKYDSSNSEDVTPVSPVETFKTCKADESPFKDLINCFNLKRDTKEDIVLEMNSVLQTIKRNTHLPRSQSLFSAIHDYLVLVELVILVILGASDAGLLMRVIFETVSIQGQSESFNHIVSTLSSLLTTPQAQEEFFNLVLLPSVLRDSSLLPESLPIY